MIKGSQPTHRLVAVPRADAVKPEDSAADSLRFGHAEVWPRQRRLCIDGAEVTPGGRAFDLLMALIERRERVVSRNELYDQVWPGRVIEENNLTVQVMALRKLLGPRAIATVPGRGYRFTLVADDESNGASPSPVQERPVLDAHTAPRRPRFTPPGEPPSLLGRDDDLSALEHLLLHHRHVTVIGAGGIGKTALALAAAHAERGTQRDGVAWVDLSAVLQPELVTAAVAQAFGLVVARAERPLAALVDELKSLHVLLVLDNAEHLVDEAARVANAIADGAPNVRLLVTSQVALKVDAERVLRLSPLAVPETGTAADEAMNYGAVALFVDQAQAADRGFALTKDNVGTVIDLCRHLDGLALAIKLAAGRLAFFGLQALEQRLAKRLRLLTGASRSAPTRQQTLRAAMDWSYGLLSRAEQTTFRRLGVFVGGFTLELAAAVVCDEANDEWAVIEQLSALVDRSFVSVDSGEPQRYRLLESAREYALAKLEETGEIHGVQQRHAKAMLMFFEEAWADKWQNGEGGSDTAFFKATAPEIDNLRAALDWSETHEPQVAVELAGAAGYLFLFLSLQNEFRHRCARLEPVLDVHPNKAAAARLWIAWFECDARSPVGFRARLLKAVALYGELGDVRHIHEALCMLGHSAFAGAEAAERALVEAAALEQPGWPAALLARRHLGEGYVHWARGQFGPMCVAVDRAVALIRSTRKERLRALCENIAVVARLGAGDIDYVLAHTQALLDASRAGRWSRPDLTWPLRAGALLRLGRIDEARQALGQFFAYSRSIGWERLVRFGYEYFALAIAERRPIAAALLLGFARRERSVLAWSDDVDNLHRKENSLAEALGKAAFQRLLAQGETLDEEAVCELTLETVDRAV